MRSNTLKNRPEGSADAVNSKGIHMISLNTNMASMAASYNSSNTNRELQRSLQRLSSGLRINSSSDDAGGLAVSMRLSAAIRRTEATDRNVNNAMSFLATQDGVLDAAGKVLTRLAELAQLNADVTKTTSDRAMYETEFDELVTSIDSMTDETFNGTDLFAAGVTLQVTVSEDGTRTTGITQADLAAIHTDLAAIDFLADAVTDTIDAIDTAINDLAEIRAQNGAEQTVLTHASDLLKINQINLEAANSQIIDLDVAKESANLSRLNIMQQAGMAMLAQANQSNDAALRLLY